MSKEIGRFQLDTSGAVCTHSPLDGYVWPDLTPFTRGYIEALLREFNRTLGGVVREAFKISQPMPWTILAPEALATIIRDCANAVSAFGRIAPFATEDGRLFWLDRQSGSLTKDNFPPLTPTLGDDGLVYLETAQ